LVARSIKEFKHRQFKGELRMGIVSLPKKYSQIKPTLGARINPSHPLAKGLFIACLVNEGGGAFHNLVTGNKCDPSASTGSDSDLGNMSWQRSPYGSAVEFPGTYPQAPQIHVSTDYDNLRNVSLAVLAKIINPSTGFNQLALDKGGGYGPSIFFDNTAQQWHCWRAQGNYGGCVGKNFAANKWSWVSCSLGDVGVTPRMYEDGVETTTSPNTTTGFPGDDGQSYITDSQFVGQVACYLAWNRLLNPTEHMMLARDPWSLFSAPEPSARFFTSTSSLISVSSVLKHFHEAMTTASVTSTGKQESIFYVTRALIQVHEALKGVVITSILDQETLQRIAQTYKKEQESIQGITRTSTLEQEASGFSTKTTTSIQEATAKIQTVQASEQESLLTVAKVHTLDQECLKGIQNAVNAFQEASGFVTKLVGHKQESIAVVSAANTLRQESLLSLSRVYINLQEALKGVSKAYLVDQESKGFAQAVTTAIHESRAFVSTSNTGKQESLIPLTRQLNAALEALLSVSKTLQQEQDAIKGVSKTSIHYQEATAVLVLSAVLIEASRVLLSIILESSSVKESMVADLTKATTSIILENSGEHI
jgi:hypothetical protein